jgi:hypothetical protein
MDISALQSNTLLILTAQDLQNFAEAHARSVLSSFPKETPAVQEQEQPITQPEALKFLGKSRQTFSKYRKKGIIKAHILGGRVYYFKSELLTAMSGR